MISYVECLGGEGAGPGVASYCWNPGDDDERDELLPRKMAALRPKMEGSLRRRLLCAKIQQHHDAIWELNINMTGGSPSAKPHPPHLQFSGNSPWFCPQQLPPQTNRLSSLPLVAPAHPPVQIPQPSCSARPALTHWRRTSSCSPMPEPRPGYSLPAPVGAPPPFKEPEAPPQHRYWPSRRRRLCFSPWRVHTGWTAWKDATQTTPLVQRGTARNYG